MLLAVTGVHPIKFDEVDGTKVYGVVKDNKKTGIIGEPTAGVWFPAERYPSLPDCLYVGSLVEIFFEQGSKTPAFVREADL